MLQRLDNDFLSPMLEAKNTTILSGIISVISIVIAAAAIMSSAVYSASDVGQPEELKDLSASSISYTRDTQPRTDSTYSIGADANEYLYAWLDNLRVGNSSTTNATSTNFAMTGGSGSIGCIEAGADGSFVITGSACNTGGGGGSGDPSLTTTSTDILGNTLLGTGTWKTATGTPFSLYIGGDLQVEDTATTTHLYITGIAANSWLATNGINKVIATSTQPISEVPSGTVNGSNTAFTLSQVPADTDDLIISVNGAVTRNGTDFTLAGNAITFTIAPETGWTLFSHYQAYPSGLQFGLNATVVTKTGNYTVLAADGTILMNNSSSATVTLPTAAGVSGKIYVIKKIDSSAALVTIDGDGTETIDGGLTAVLTAEGESISIISDNSNWHIH